MSGDPFAQGQLELPLCGVGVPLKNNVVPEPESMQLLLAIKGLAVCDKRKNKNFCLRLLKQAQLTLPPSQ